MPASIFGEPPAARKFGGLKILVPEIFCGPNFQLKNPNRSIYISLHKYAFKKLWKKSKKAENGISNSC